MSNPDPVSPLRARYGARYRWFLLLSVIDRKSVV